MSEEPDEAGDGEPGEAGDGEPGEAGDAAGAADWTYAWRARGVSLVRAEYELSLLWFITQFIPPGYL